MSVCAQGARRVWLKANAAPDYAFVYLSRRGLIAVRSAVMHHYGKNRTEIALASARGPFPLILDDVAKVRRNYFVPIFPVGA